MACSCGIRSNLLAKNSMIIQRSKSLHHPWCWYPSHRFRHRVFMRFFFLPQPIWLLSPIAFATPSPPLVFLHDSHQFLSSVCLNLMGKKIYGQFRVDEDQHSPHSIRVCVCERSILYTYRNTGIFGRMHINENPNTLHDLFLQATAITTRTKKKYGRIEKKNGGG